MPLTRSPNDVDVIVVYTHNIHDGQHVGFDEPHAVVLDHLLVNDHQRFYVILPTNRPSSSSSSSTSCQPLPLAARRPIATDAEFQFRRLGVELVNVEVETSTADDGRLERRRRLESAICGRRRRRNQVK